MSDYIKRKDAMTCEIHVIIPIEDKKVVEQVVQGIIDHIKSVPSADVVEVVHCKNCKYKEHERCGLTKYTVREHDYCSYGEENSK